MGETAWKMVPVEITPKMQSAWTRGLRSMSSPDRVQDAYSAMLAAAPEPPAPSPVEGDGLVWNEKEGRKEPSEQVFQDASRTTGINAGVIRAAWRAVADTPTPTQETTP